MEPPSIYLINPRTDFPVYYGAEIFGQSGLPPAAFVADLSIATVAGLVPRDFAVELCDESVGPADLEHPADFIGITGRSSQRNRMLALAREYRKRGKTVILGGPYASLSPEAVRDECTVLVRGEIEEIAERLFGDLRAGAFADEYEGSRPDLGRTPLPRWDLYPTGRALQGCLQTSRGCPHRCDFCDTTRYTGASQRHKPTDRVLAELDVLHGLGFRTVFLADDNFTANPVRARALLTALRDWNARAAGGPVRFATQMSIDAARHPELLSLCSEAGLSEAFVGIETSNRESLRHCGKMHNLDSDPIHRVEDFVRHGIGVIGGLVVGFDPDPPGIFHDLYEFAMAMPVPTFSVNALHAPPSTPLFERMRLEGRLLPSSEVPGPLSPWWTNFAPKQMSAGELAEGVQALMRRLYHPRAFEIRTMRFLELFPPGIPCRRPGRPRRDVDIQGINLVRRFPRLGPEEKETFARLVTAARKKPAAQRHLFADLFRYIQIRAMYSPPA